MLPTAGKYIVAVSGGVDSVVLLDILRQEPGLELLVAHFDHGMRSDSSEDREFVEDLAESYGLPFIHEEGRLGIGASEATARAARYKFLHKVRQSNGAAAIITAHHQDDVLETAIINLLRGTGRKGLTSLQSRADIVRPLLSFPKSALLTYAKRTPLVWHEDSTNQNLDYLRNYVRQKILPRLGDEGRAQLLEIINQTRDINDELDGLLELLSDGGGLKRNFLNQLPHPVAREVMAGWLRQRAVGNFGSKTLERLVVAAKTASAGQVFPVLGGYFMEVKRRDLALRVPER